MELVMSRPLLVLMLCAWFVVRIEGEIPDGYILQVTPSCGNSIAGDASISIITDLNDVWVKAICYNAEVNFTSTDGVNFNLAVSYPNQGSESCVFVKRNSTEVYVIRVVVMYGEAGRQVHQDEEEYTISCTFDPKGLDASSDQNFITGLIAPDEIQTNMGSDSGSILSLKMVDVVGNDLNATSVRLGRTIMLRGYTSGTEGIRPVSCDAVDGSSRYAILRAGCGDGIIFPHNVGFMTSGNTTTSPYFKAFCINNDPVMNFECSFVTCTITACDGSSCSVENGGSAQNNFLGPLFAG